MNLLFEIAVVFFGGTVILGSLFFIFVMVPMMIKTEMETLAILEREGIPWWEVYRERQKRR
jgi:hypothetical protein